MSRTKEKVGKPSKMSALERSKLHAQKLLNKVIPFEIWSTTEKRTESEIKVYWLVVNGLNKITKEGQPEELKCQGRN